MYLEHPQVYWKHMGYKGKTNKQIERQRNQKYSCQTNKQEYSLVNNIIFVKFDTNIQKVMNTFK